MVRKIKAGKAWRHPDQLPLLTPDSNWVAPAPEFWPDFSGVKYLGVDTETHDPQLQEHGPGFIRGDASLCGISLADENGRRIYLPIGHAEGNVDKGKALEYVQHQVKLPGITKVGANIMYDMESLWSEGIKVHGDFRDVQVAEPLLDEDRPGGYSLDALAFSYLGRQKDEQLLKEAGAAYGGDVNPKKLAKVMPAKYWGPYGEQDADLPVQVYLKQLERLKSEDLIPVFDLETELTPVLFAMRLQGVRVDLEEAERLAKETRGFEDELVRWLQAEAKWDFNPFSSEDVGKIMESRGFDVPNTAAGNFSITNEWLQELGDVDGDTKQPSGEGDDFSAQLYELRRINKMRKDFIEGAILGRNVRGRLHNTWHQLREYDDEAGRNRGTRSGRIAASKPNLTNVPARDPVWGKRVRRLFVADEGKRWAKLDYSQQEPRFLLHFAYLMDQLPRSQGGQHMPGAVEAVELWRKNPKIDYHQMVADLIEARSGKAIGRRPAKDINLGGAYGMGVAKLLAKLKVDQETGQGILNAYHEGVPYVKLLSKSCMDRAQERGFIRTILGRKRRFNEWERRKKWDDSDWSHGSKKYRSLEEATEAYGIGNVVRAGVHKALNALVQGSAGDQMKKTLVLLYKAGILPNIQVYDELDLNWDDPEILRVARRTMETSVPINVPHLVEPEVGPSWGELEDWKDAA